jgi:two-component system sensor histidine kinase AtoS
MRLPATRGLCRWLTTQGRPARLDDLSDVEAARDLALVHGVVAVPLLAHGDLTAVLIIGPPVFGSSYGRQETETLFDLATHLATAIRDIALHEQLRQEKEFTERILAHMASGVVTIGRDHRIGTFNERAEEILGLRADDVVEQDLRVLPSPLGDMLFDTLSSGRVVRRSEIQLALGKRWLEVSTYPVQSEERTPLGAVLVFEDVTAHKELAAQKSQADQLQLLTRVVARISDEIKNPLVSINAFTELLDERYDDPDFRTRFTAVVQHDVHRLVQVFEKLTGLTSEGELNFTTVDVRSVLDHFATVVEAGDDAAGRRVQLTALPGDRPLMVKVDAPKLRKALAYLVRYLAHNSPAGEAKVSVAMDLFETADSGESARILVASRTAAVPPERLERLFDPVQSVQESLIDIGPAVSQRLVEAFGGSVRFRQSRHELAFLVTLPLVAA